MVKKNSEGWDLNCSLEYYENYLKTEKDPSEIEFIKKTIEKIKDQMRKDELQNNNKRRPNRSRK